MVHDKSCKVGGHQCIVTNDGYVIPINIINGMPYIRMRLNTKNELEESPCIILTSCESWDLTVLDYKLLDKEDWYNEFKSESNQPLNSPFDKMGWYKHWYKRDPHRP